MTEPVTDKSLRELRERLLGSRYEVDARAVATAIVARLAGAQPGSA